MKYYIEQTQFGLARVSNTFRLEIEATTEAEAQNIFNKITNPEEWDADWEDFGTLIPSATEVEEWIGCHQGEPILIIEAEK